MGWNIGRADQNAAWLFMRAVFQAYTQGMWLSGVGVRGWVGCASLLLGATACPEPPSEAAEDGSELGRQSGAGDDRKSRDEASGAGDPKRLQNSISGAEKGRERAAEDAKHEGAEREDAEREGRRP